ncbi:MAG: DEAD/DEAH box helicase [Microlunatus sp.]|nr:DEAD/DEAH box helicase [Microlunatus sp.]
MWAGLLSNDAIIAMVGHEAFARGMVYARNGNAADVTVDAEQMTVTGQVIGSERRRYLALVELVGDEGWTGHRATCTCPVVRDCKHAAAVLIVARAQLAVQSRTARPEWEDLVGRLVRESEADEFRPVELGLQFSVQIPPVYAGKRQAPQLSIRAVRRGAKGRWVSSGRLSWSDLDYVSTDLPVELQDLLLQFRGAAGAVARYGNPRSAWLGLDQVSTAFWSLLENASRVGLTLMTEKAGPPVVIGERVAVRLDLRAIDGGGLTGTPGLPTEVWSPAELFEATDSDDPTFGLIGQPAHGAFWLAPPTAPSGPRDLMLVRLERPLPGELRRVVQTRIPLHVPASDRQRFVEVFLPGLRRVIPVVSTDSSVELPEAPQPEIVLMVGFRPEHRVRLDWLVRYFHRGTWERFGIDQPTGSDRGLRDVAGEQALLERLDLPYADLPQLADSRYVRRPAAHALLGDVSAARFVHDIAPVLNNQGVVIEFDGEAIDYRPAEHEPEVTLATEETDLSDWFDLHIQVRVDGEPVPFEDLFVALSGGAEFLVLETGVYVPLDTPTLDRLRELIEEARSLQDRDRPQLRISRFQIALWDDLSEVATVVEAADRWQTAVRALAGSSAGDGATGPSTPAGPLPVPPGLRADLRPYQQDGFAWLTRLWQHGLGGILADDMGLGKTVQTLAMMAHARGHDSTAPPFLVIAPTSVTTTWAAEAARFVPNLIVRVISRSVAKLQRPLSEEIAGADVVITSYALLRIDHEAYAETTASGPAWSGLVLDEAQFVKNHRAKTYQAARRVSARMKLAITGTPVENSLLDLWSMLSLAAPGLFPSSERFTQYYVRPIERDRDEQRLAQLRQRIAPVVLRRTKDLVARELPPKQEQVLEVALQPRHARIYQTHLQRERQKVLGLIDDLEDNRFTILRSLTLLRQLALDPALVDEQHAGVAASKTETLVEMLTEVVQEGHRALVFSQFTGYLRRVEHRLRTAGLPTAYLDGSTTDRETVIRRFRDGEAAAFLISLRAGGFGLNLTEADYCFVLDPWWNPAAEQQAVDRAHRLGQTRPVMVYRLVAKDTIEEKVMALKARKSALFDAVLGGDSLSSAAFGADEIRELLGLDRAIRPRSANVSS